MYKPCETEVNRGQAGELFFLSTHSEKNALLRSTLQTLINNRSGRDRGSYRRPITKATRTKAWDGALNARREKKEGGVRGKGTHSKASNFSPSCMLNVGECQRRGFLWRCEFHSMLSFGQSRLWGLLFLEACWHRSVLFGGEKKGIQGNYIITSLSRSCSLPPLWHLLLLTVMEDQREPIRKVSTSICRASLIPNWIKHSAIMF